MGIAIIIIIKIWLGYRCSNIAEKNWRDTTTAGVLWFLFWIRAIIWYAIAGKKTGVNITINNSPHQTKKQKASSYFESTHNKN